MTIPHYIIDNALTEEEVAFLRDFSANEMPELNVRSKWEEIAPLYPIVDIASQHFDLDSATGYEVWEQQNSRPSSWHFDKDELLADYGIKDSYPLCTTVYYLNVDENLIGGRLILRDVSIPEKIYITPVTNRLVVFPPGIEHYVEPFEGERHSIMCNPWNKLLGQIN